MSNRSGLLPSNGNGRAIAVTMENRGAEQIVNGKGRAFAVPKCVGECCVAGVFKSGGDRGHAASTRTWASKLLHEANQV